MQGSFDDDDAFDQLARPSSELEGPRHRRQRRVLPVDPADVLPAPSCKQIKRTGLAESTTAPWRRVVVEKPFGHDLPARRELNAIVDSVFRADDVFRIDHYLGKETVQNLLALRFANTLFEPIWNGNYVDYVQITMAEDVGIGGRAGFYEETGAARDVLQNHLLQLLALTAMEEPVEFRAEEIRRREAQGARARSRCPTTCGQHTARGQYAQGWQAGAAVLGYREEEGVAADSTTETFAAVRLGVETRRWAGVPFYLRTGKRLARRVTEIALVFKRAPHLPFEHHRHRGAGQNALVIRVQPDEGDHPALRVQGARHRDGGPRRRRWTSPTASRSPSRARRPTSG